MGWGERPLLNSFYEASVTLTPTATKTSPKQENYRSVPLVVKDTNTPPPNSKLYPATYLTLDDLSQNAGLVQRKKIYVIHHINTTKEQKTKSI